MNNNKMSVKKIVPMETIPDRKKTNFVRPGVKRQANEKQPVVVNQKLQKLEAKDVKTVAAKPAPYDYKAKFNLLKERHIALKDNMTQVKQKLEETESGE